MDQETIHTVAAPEEGETEQRTGVRVFLEYFKTVLMTILVAMLLKVLVIEAYRIPSGSMEDTLMVGDFLLVNKIAYGFHTPRYVPLTNVRIPSVSIPLFSRVERGDVVVFELPQVSEYTDGEERITYIKRCIGLPGDTVMIRAGRVFVNGKELTLPAHAKVSNSGILSWNTGSRLVPGGRGYTEDDYGPVVVPQEGTRITLSRETIDDWESFIRLEGHSVEVGPNDGIHLDGKPAAGYTVEDDYYFMLGDNRHNSLDSRFWGFVPRENLVGEALMVYWSWDTDLGVTSMGDKLRSIRWGRIGTFIR